MNLCIPYVVPLLYPTIVRVFGFDLIPFGSTWQPRRVAWTREIIYLTPVNDTAVIDLIPFDEVHQVTFAAAEIQDRPKKSRKSKESDSASDNRDLKDPDRSNTRISADSSTAVNLNPVTPPHRKSTSASTATEDAAASQSRPRCGREAMEDGHNHPEVFQIRTMTGGFNAGRTYYLRAPCRDTASKTAAALTALAIAARRSAESKSRFRRSQETVRPQPDWMPVSAARSASILPRR